MPLSTSFPQASLAAGILASAVGNYYALSPPNANPDLDPSPAIPDTIRRLKLTSKHTLRAALAPLGFLALHASALASTHPDIPPALLRHGAENGLAAGLVTWSPATAVPLALIVCAGVPLRLGSYASLGDDFTFALRTPGRLNTGGIYRYVQHPSYTGIAVLLLSNAALLLRTDGVVSCWVPPSWYWMFRYLIWAAAPVGLCAMFFGMWTRVRQEERMLRGKFGIKWEEWHSKTPRFLPWVF